ncbi:unnamed protein product [Linum trigynum]|uniref:Uncharacterized protein n=1 Tax=Linum trigynum TaxID=586398 RepID=A0AAV2G1I9_9ROSI
MGSFRRFAPPGGRVIMIPRPASSDSSNGNLTTQFELGEDTALTEAKTATVNSTSGQTSAATESSNHGRRMDLRKSGTVATADRFKDQSRTADMERR